MSFQLINSRTIFYQSIYVSYILSHNLAPTQHMTIDLQPTSTGFIIHRLHIYKKLAWKKSLQQQTLTLQSNPHIPY